MSKTKPDFTPEQPASPGLLTLPGRTLDQPALPALPEPAGPASRALTAAEFRGLAEVPPELEWFANIRNEKTRRAYQQDVKDFTRFVGIARPEEFRSVTRIVDPGKWTRGLDRMPRNERGNRRGKKAV